MKVAGGNTADAVLGFIESMVSGINKIPGVEKFLPGVGEAEEKLKAVREEIQGFTEDAKKDQAFAELESKRAHDATKFRAEQAFQGTAQAVESGVVGGINQVASGANTIGITNNFEITDPDFLDEVFRKSEDMNERTLREYSNNE